MERDFLMIRLSVIIKYGEFKTQTRQFTQSLPRELGTKVRRTIRELRNTGNFEYGAARTYEQIRSSLRSALTIPEEAGEKIKIYGETTNRADTR